jgi:hypothetical protein
MTTPIFLERIRGALSQLQEIYLAHPDSFLTEADVQCVLFQLLAANGMPRGLIHAEAPVRFYKKEAEAMGKRARSLPFDLAVLEPGTLARVLSAPASWEARYLAVIEVKNTFRRREGIENDLKKMCTLDRYPVYRFMVVLGLEDQPSYVEAFEQLMAHWPFVEYWYANACTGERCDWRGMLLKRAQIIESSLETDGDLDADKMDDVFRCLYLSGHLPPERLVDKAKELLARTTRGTADQDAAIAWLWIHLLSEDYAAAWKEAKPLLRELRPALSFDQLGCIIAAVCQGSETGPRLCQEGLQRATLCDLDMAIFYLRDLMGRQSKPHSAELALEKKLLDEYSDRLQA